MTNYEAGFNALFDDLVMNEGLHQAVKWWNLNIGNDEWVEQLGLDTLMEYLYIHNLKIEIEVDKEPDFNIGEQWKPDRYFIRPLKDISTFKVEETMTALYDLHKLPVLMIVKYHYDEETNNYNNEVWITFDGETFTGSIEEL
jgi:hypothetical protein